LKAAPHSTIYFLGLPSFTIAMLTTNVEGFCQYCNLEGAKSSVCFVPCPDKLCPTWNVFCLPGLDFGLHFIMRLGRYVGNNSGEKQCGVKSQFIFCCHIMEKRWEFDKMCVCGWYWYWKGTT